MGNNKHSQSITTENGYKGRTIPEIDTETANRFWSNVDIQGPDDCWLWTGGTFKEGYGGFTIDRTGPGNGSFGAHRIAYKLATGLDPIGKVVCHSCDEKLCTNSRHLTVGTQKSNMSAASERHRMQHGETHCNAVYSDEDVRRMRLLVDSGVARKHVQDAFGVSASHLSKLMNGQARTQPANSHEA